MEMERRSVGSVHYALLNGNEVILTDAQSALNLMVDVQYRLDVNRIAVPKRAVKEDFFILSTGLAGEVLQKFVNYGVKLAIYGDFSRYTSKPLKDFMYESNNGGHVFFAASAEEAGEMLCRA